MIKFGSYIGYVFLEVVKEVGVVGMFFNYLENRMILVDFEVVIRRVEEVGLMIMVCFNNLVVLVVVVVFGLDYVVVELLELIGIGILVSKVKFEVVMNIVEFVKKVNFDVGVLIGVGIFMGEDVKKVFEFGSVGVFFVSGVMKVKDLENVIREDRKSVV